MALVLVRYVSTFPSNCREQLVSVLRPVVAEQLDCHEDPLRPNEVTIWADDVGPHGAQEMEVGVIIFAGSYLSRDQRLEDATERIEDAVRRIDDQISCFVWIIPIKGAAFRIFHPPA
jgi:hypothetical protein